MSHHSEDGRTGWLTRNTDCCLIMMPSSGGDGELHQCFIKSSFMEWLKINRLCVTCRGFVLCVYISYVYYNMIYATLIQGDWNLIIPFANTCCSSWFQKIKLIFICPPLLPHPIRFARMTKITCSDDVTWCKNPGSVDSNCKCIFPPHCPSSIDWSFGKVRLYDFNEQHILLNIPTQTSTTVR